MKELRKEVVSHFSVTLVYFFLVSLFNLGLGWRLLIFWLGALIGTFLLDIDHIILGLNPLTEAEWAAKFKALWKEKKYKEAIIVGADSHVSHRRLIFHSVIFQPILLILTFFILTSTGSLFGAGLIMSMNLHLLKDLWHCYLEEKRLAWFFWPLKQLPDQKFQQAYLFVMTGFFLLLTLFLI